MLEDPRAAAVLIAGDIPILRAGQPATALLASSDLARVTQRHEQVFLGTLGERPVIGTLAPPEAADLFRVDPDFVVSDLRTAAVQGLVPAEELGILAMAKSLLDWHRRHRFCAQCGSPTHAAAAGFRRDCSQCGTQHFPRTDPVVIMLVVRGGNCLLGRQARFRRRHVFLPRGLPRTGRDDRGCRAARDLRRGRRPNRTRLATPPRSPGPFPSSLMIGCIAEALTDAITIDRAELEDARWFSTDEVRQMIDRQHPEDLMAAAPIAIAHHLIRGWAFS